MPKVLNIPKEELEQYYSVERKTMKEIAEIYHCNYNTISLYITKYGIEKFNDKPWMIERNKKEKKKYNEYDLSGEYGTGYASNTHHQFYFDLEDYDKIKDVCWHENSKGYLCGRYKNNKTIKMHQLIMDDKHIDHMNHNTLDNRKQNLRKSNDLLNSRNRSLPSNNTSGYKGVSWKKREQKWAAYITIYGKQKELGLYDDINEAIEARRKADDKYFGEWSYEKSILGG